MRKESDVKYPNSANLFRLCRRVLDHKYNGIRVIDQDVGQILNFDPADCSHWKKGKKNIRSIQAMKSIANHLGVDERLVVDVATGEISDHEAFAEYSGYGPLKVDANTFEVAKKTYYRKFAGSWSKEKEQNFKEYFQVREPLIDKIVIETHQKINFKEAPLYLPEITTSYPDLIFSADPDFPNGNEKSPEVKVLRHDDKTEIRYRSGSEIQPHMRFTIAKAIATHFLFPYSEARKSIEGLEEYCEHIEEIEANIFACKLLAPEFLIRKEMAQLNPAKDIIAQLAETFWVSKTFMNLRLKSILEENSQL
ncbi:MAG: ImmA/IrrE family metallo-endopeptidase [Bdellovibrionota bacterium]